MEIGRHSQSLSHSDKSGNKSQTGPSLIPLKSKSHLPALFRPQKCQERETEGEGQRNIGKWSVNV